MSRHEDYDQAPGWPDPSAGKVVPTPKREPARPRNEPRPLWLRALCPRPNGHVWRMVQAGKVKRQPGVV